MPRLAKLLGCLAASCAVFTSAAALGDSWRFEPTRKDKSFEFGETKIVLTVDGTKDQRAPDFFLRVFHRGQLQAQMRDVWFEQVFASPDNTFFVGLSNSGIPGTAVVIFDRHGSLRLLVNHGLAEFDYCEKSVTIARRWYDEKNPSLRFLPEKEAKGSSGITLRDCRGQTVDLIDVVLKAYNLAS